MFAPVRMGDTIRVHITVKEKKETAKPVQGLQVWRYDVLNQRDERVMSLDMNFLMHRRPQEG